MSQGDIDAALAAVRLWNEDERERFLEAFQPDGQWSSAIKRQVEGGEGLYRGRKEIGEFWDEWHAVWSGLKIIVTEAQSPRDGCVLAFGALQGTGIGSGAETERPFAWVFQIQKGLIAEVRAFFSREEALQAVESEPPAASGRPH